MADLVITPANVIKGSVTAYPNLTATGIAGETITAGQAVYINASDSNKIYKADANASSSSAAAVGIALHAALAGQPVQYMTSGALTFGAILTVGQYYVVSATAGGIAPTADLASGWYSTLLMWGYSTSVAIVNPIPTGVAIA